jgi:hypothetical protein
MSRLLVFAFLCVAVAETDARNNGSPSPAAAMQSKTSTAGGGGGGRGYRDPRHAPPMDPKRKVSEQDCSKPVNLEAGNLKCK